MTARFVVMANGKGLRWGNHLGIPKHLIQVNGETLLDRIVRQVLAVDPGAQVIISAKDPRYETAGATRHVPARDDLEIDRFVPELVSDNVTFLYGDTYYTDEAMATIVSTRPLDLLFFGNERRVGAVKVGDGARMLGYLRELRAMCESGELPEAKGWQLYQMHTGGAVGSPRPGLNDASFVRLPSDAISDFNTPEDLEELQDRFAPAGNGIRTETETETEGMRP